MRDERTLQKVKNKMITMWSEKHRPTKLADCVLSHLHPYEKMLLESSEASEQIPNIFLFGTPGTGKSTIAQVLCNEEKFSVRHLNGSLLGKAAVASINATLHTRSILHDHRCILIDEVDCVKAYGPKAFRARMESNDAELSWIFTANSRSSVINPLQSRMICINCSVPEPSDRQLHIEGIVKRCEVVLQEEGVTGVNVEEVIRIVELNYPDIRQMLNQLQVRYAPMLIH